MGEFSRALGEGWVVPVKDGEQTVEWKLSHLSQKLKARFELWLESTVQRALLAAKGRMPPQDYAEQLSIFYENKALGKYGWGEVAWERSIRSTAGICQLFRLLLEKHHPEVAEWSQEQIDTLLAKSDGFAEVLREVLDGPNSSAPGATTAPSA